MLQAADRNAESELGLGQANATPNGAITSRMPLSMIHVLGKRLGKLKAISLRKLMLDLTRSAIVSLPGRPVSETRNDEPASARRALDRPARALDLS